jgi:hypothetical protein
MGVLVGIIMSLVVFRPAVLWAPTVLFLRRGSALVLLVVVEVLELRAVVGILGVVVLVVVVVVQVRRVRGRRKGGVGGRRARLLHGGERRRGSGDGAGWALFTERATFGAVVVLKSRRCSQRRPS